QPDDLEALCVETLVAEERSREVADADERGAPGAVDAQCRAERRRQVLRLVPDAALPEVAEGGEVAADLRVADVHRGRDAPARNLAAIGRPRGHATQVQ